MTTFAANYEKQLETAKNGYKAVIDTVNKTLNDDKLYSAFSSYSDKVKDIVTAKANSYIAAQEEILSKLIDSDLFSDFVLADEVIILYDLIRDECVKRLALSIREEI